MKKQSIVVAALAAMLHASSVFAQEDDDREFRRIARTQNDQPEEALTRYQAIYERSRSPRALAQIAGVEAQLGRWVQASEHLAEALAATGNAWIARHRDSLLEVQRRIRDHVSDLSVTVNVPGAQISVNGQARGTLPLSAPLRVLTGQTRIEITAEGHETLRHLVDATPGPTRVELSLVPVAPPSTPPTRVVPPAPVAVVAPPVPEAVAVPVVAPTPVAPPRSPLRALGIASLAVGAVGFGLGGAGIVLRNGAVADFVEANCAYRNEVVIGGGSCQQEFDRGTSMGTLATAGFVVGGVFSVAGLALLIAAPASGAREHRAAIRCGWGPGSIGVGCGGSF